VRLVAPSAPSREWEGTAEEKRLRLKLPNNSRFPHLGAVVNNLMCGSQDEHRLPLALAFAQELKKWWFCIFVTTGKLVLALP